MNLVLTKPVKKNKEISQPEWRKVLLNLPIADPWEAVRGMWKKRKISPLRFQKKLRNEWV